MAIATILAFFAAMSVCVAQLPTIVVDCKHAVLTDSVRVSWLADSSDVNAALRTKGLQPFNEGNPGIWFVRVPNDETVTLGYENDVLRSITRHYMKGDDYQTFVRAIEAKAAKAGLQRITSEEGVYGSGVTCDAGELAVKVEIRAKSIGSLSVIQRWTPF